ncbi:hypothetical protein [Minwuia sp.]|uniref:hypothetical protein n=1 Tax=Minwuia sp. TaxID=2493630 RepID=UPI003A952482
MRTVVSMFRDAWPVALVGCLAVLLCTVPTGPVDAQERGDAPASVGRERIVRDLERDNQVSPGANAAEIARTQTIRRLDQLDALRSQGDELSAARRQRLLADQQARQTQRETRSFDPETRRRDRRRDRVDRRLRQRLNRR